MGDYLRKLISLITDYAMVTVTLAFGIISSLIAAILYTRHVRRLEQRERNRSPAPAPTPHVDAFKAMLEPSGYERFPQAGEPHYYIKRYDETYGQKPSMSDPPTYHFFSENGIKVERFRGFLIPPLDAGHGRYGEDGAADEMSFNDKWYEYLSGINNNVQGAEIKQRIVFFDKTLLDLFLFETDRIFADAQMDGPRFPRLDWERPTTASARRLLRYVYDIAKIHELIREPTDCRYISKATVAASSYYDFGLYRIDGVDIVYAPIPFKNEIKSIAREKVYIGDTDEQRLGIDEFERDFNVLWDKSTSIVRRHDEIAKHIHKERLVSPSDDYYGEPCYSLKLFGAVYKEQIRDIILARTARDVDEEGFTRHWKAAQSKEKSD